MPKQDSGFYLEKGERIRKERSGRGERMTKRDDESQEDRRSWRQIAKCVDAVGQLKQKTSKNNAEVKKEYQSLFRRGST